MCACPFSLDHNQIAHDYGMYYLTDYRKRGLIANKFLRYGLFSAKFYTKTTLFSSKHSPVFPLPHGKI